MAPHIRRFRTICLIAGAILLWASVGTAQQSRPVVRTVYQVGTNAGDATLVPVPQLGGTPVAGGSPGAAVSLGTPGFDPYATGPPAASTPPSLSGAPVAPYGSTTPPNWGVPSWNAATTPQAAPTFPVYPGGTVATTLNFPNFLWTNRPLHVSPTFIGHYWSGPVNVNPMVVDDGTGLPSKAYSAFLNLRWQPMLTPTFGGDIDFSFGGFSDYNTFVNDSWRFYGTGLFVATLTPTMTLKGGINYLDRYSIKMLPAFGILWTPNPKTRFDIYFPKPKLAQYLTTMGTTDVWWYLNGEYGGGSWTIERNVPGDKRVDINDIRVGGGVEWTSHRGTRGFVELAYVFDREIVFATPSPLYAPPIEKRELQDTLMIRAGLAF